MEASGWSDRLQKMTWSRCSGSWRSYSVVSSGALIFSRVKGQDRESAGQGVSMTFNEQLPEDNTRGRVPKRWSAAAQRDRSGSRYTACSIHAAAACPALSLLAAALLLLHGSKDLTIHDILRV